MDATHQPRHLGPCLEYEGTKNKNGYGVLPRAVHGSRLAHRAALAEHLGRPVEGFALHRCDNPPCIRGDHLYEGDQRQNVEDAVERGRVRGGRYNQTHCKWDHELTEDNVVTYTRASTRKTITARRCIKCRQRNNDQAAARRKAARHRRGLVHTGGNHNPKRQRSA